MERRVEPPDPVPVAAPGSARWLSGVPSHPEACYGCFHAWGAAGLTFLRKGPWVLQSARCDRGMTDERSLVSALPTRGVRMLRGRSARLVLIFLLAVGLLVAAGCGGGDDEGAGTEGA